MKKEDYKTMKEILNGVPDRIHHPKSAEQLASLALTKFAEQITEKGATILSCSPKQIKLDNGNIVKVVGKYLKYTYNFHCVFYMQFDSNPFFAPKGYISNHMGHSTGFTELPTIFDGVNEYSVDDENVQNLTCNIYKSEKYLNDLSYRHVDKSNNKFDQCIYYF